MDKNVIISLIVAFIAVYFIDQSTLPNKLLYEVIAAVGVGWFVFRYVLKDKRRIWFFKPLGF